MTSFRIHLYSNICRNKKQPDRQISSTIRAEVKTEVADKLPGEVLVLLPEVMLQVHEEIDSKLQEEVSSQVKTEVADKLPREVSVLLTDLMLQVHAEIYSKLQEEVSSQVKTVLLSTIQSEVKSNFDVQAMLPQPEFNNIKIIQSETDHKLSNTDEFVFAYDVMGSVILPNIHQSTGQELTITNCNTEDLTIKVSEGDVFAEDMTTTQTIMRCFTLKLISHHDKWYNLN